MALSSISKLRLEILAGASVTNIDALKKLRKELSQTETKPFMGETSKAFNKSLENYIKASKHPFITDEQFKQAEKIINAYQKKITAVNKQIEKSAGARPGQEKQLKGLTSELNAWESAYAKSIKYREGLEQQSLSKTKQIEKERQSFLKGQDAGYQANLKRAIAASARDKITQEKRSQNEMRVIQKAHVDKLVAEQKLLNAQNKQYQTDWKNAITENTRFDKQAKQSAISAQKQLVANERTRQGLINQTLQMSEKYIRNQQALSKIGVIREQVAGIKATDPQAINKLNQTRQAIANLNGQLMQQQVQLGPLGRAWDKFRTVFSRVFDALVSFMIMSWTAKIFVGFFTSLIKSNQLLEVLQARLKALIPTADEVRAIWASLAELTISTPFKLQDFVEAATLVKAFGVDIVKNMEAIADWASAVGKDLSDTAVAFGKIASYSPRTALLLSTRGFSLALFESYVEKYKNRTVALNKLIQDTFGGTARRISRTFEGLLTNINDLWVLISQKLGEPLFKALKDDVRLFYNLMVEMNKDSGKGLTIIGEQIKNIIYLLTGGGVALGFAFITMQIKKLITFIKSGTALATVFNKAFIWTAVAIEIMNVVYTYKKLAQAQQDVLEGEIEFRKLNKENTSERLDQIAKIIEGYKTQLAELKSIAGGIIAFLVWWDNWFSAKYSYHGQKDLFSKKIKEWELEQGRTEMEEAARKRNLMLQNAELTVLEKYTARQEISNANLDDFYKSLVKIQQIRVDEVTHALTSAKNQGEGWNRWKNVLSIKELADIQFGEKSKLIYLQQFVEGSVSQAEAIDQAKKALEGQLSQMVKNIQESTNWKTSMEEGREELIKVLSDLDKVNKYWEDLIQKMKDYRSEFAGLLEEFRTLTKGEYSVQFSKMFGLKKELVTEKIISDTIGFAPTEDDIAKMDAYLVKIQIAEVTLNEEIRLSKLTKKEVDEKNILLNKQKKIGEDIVKYMGLIVKLEQDANEETGKRIEQYKDLIVIKRKYELQKSELGIDISGKIIKMQGGQLDETFFQKQLENYKEQRADVEKEINEFVRPLTLEDAKREIELKSEILELSKEELAILEEINQLNDTFGKSFANYVISISAEIANWRYQVVELLADTVKGFAKSSIAELLSGDKAKDLDSQLEQQRFKLHKIQQEKLGIQVIEDEEANTLAEINRLEKERANIIGTFLSNAMQKIQDKMLDMAIDKGLYELFKQFADFEGVNAIITQEQKIAKIKDEGGAKLVAWSTADLALAELRLATELKIKTAKSAGTQIGTSDIDLFIKLGSFLSGLPTGSTSIPIPIPKASYDISRLTRNIANNSYQNSQTTVLQFNGDVYGMDDFNKKVNKIMSDNKRNLV